MIHALLALAGLALAAAAPAPAAKPAAPAKHTPAKHAPAAKKPAPKKSPSKKPTPPPAAEASEVERSEGATRVADWIASSGDNQDLPYVIVDKPAARIYLFDATGKPLADAPVLIGVALGDVATPGIGAKTLAEIGPAEKTTPAGRYLAKFGLPVEGQKVLWVDYATSVALHPIPPKNKEHRRERMLSPSIDDNRITFGCINVPTAFYSKGVSPLFRKKGGYVYVLPDSKPLEEVFPRLRVQPFLKASSGL